MAKENFNIAELVNQDGCFDLQFRKDTRHERTNAPTYYRWKAQFVVTGPKENAKVLERVKKDLHYLITSGVKRLFLADSTFNLDGKRAKEILRYIGSINKDTVISTELRCGCNRCRRHKTQQCFPMYSK